MELLLHKLVQKGETSGTEKTAILKGGKCEYNLSATE